MKHFVKIVFLLQLSAVTIAMFLQSVEVCCGNDTVSWEQLKRFKRNGRYGFYDRNTGDVVVPVRFDYATRFWDGLALVSKGGEEGFIDNSGQFIIGPFGRLFPSSEGLACAGVGGPFSSIHYGYVDRNGIWEIEPQYDYAFDFSQGLAAVDRRGYFGYIDLHGELVVEHCYSWAEPHSEGLAAVWKGNRVGFIDLKGEEVIPLSFEGTGYFSEGLAAVRMGDKWGYIDTQGYWIVHPIYDEAGPFVNGCAKVLRNDKPGYLKREGLNYVK